MKYIDKYLNEIQQIEESMNVTSVFQIIGSMMPGVTDWYMNNLRASARTCVKLKAAEKTKCIIMNKIKVNNGFISKLNGMKSKCKGNEKCVAKLDKKIMKTKSKIQTLQGQLKTVTTQKYGR